MSWALRLGLSAFAIGLGANVLAAYTVPDLAPDNLGPLALAWHERSPGWVLIGVALIIGILSRMRIRRRRPFDYAVVSVVLGGTMAQAASLVWFGGRAPDYIAMRIGGEDIIIANVPDLIMSSAVLVLVGVFGANAMAVARKSAVAHANPGSRPARRSPRA